jgi:hypothetical protein
MRAATPASGGKGPSKALPIAVAAGLAVGVFAGLLIIKGTGSKSDKDEDKSGEVASKGDDGDGDDTKPDTDSDKAKAPTTDDKSDETKVAAKGDEDKAAKDGDDKATDDKDGDKADDKDGDKTAAAADDKKDEDKTDEDKKPAATEAKLTVNAPSGSRIYINGKRISGNSSTVKLTDGKAKVRVIVKKSGYSTGYKSVELTGDEEVSIELSKRKSRPKTHHRKKKKKRKTNRDLIDL